MGNKYNIDINLLGTMPDKQIAEDNHVGVYFIKKLRKQHNIDSFNKITGDKRRSELIEFSKNNDLTKITSAEIAHKLDMNINAVKYLRKHLDLPQTKIRNYHRGECVNHKSKPKHHRKKTIKLENIPNREFKNNSNIDLNIKYPHIRIFTFKNERENRGIEMVFTKGSNLL